MKGMGKVQILLSTYNGASYLQQLLESLLSQDYFDMEILIRDDGSTDRTKEILESYSGSKNISIFFEENIGTVSSFFDLMSRSADNADYYAFCDQDDLWEKGKISRAVMFLEKLPTVTPSLYCSRTKLVDENLNLLGYSRLPKRALTFNNSLVENIATGCTMVFNKATRDLIIRNIPSFALMHDYWVYQVVSAFGQVIYDREALIMYRQHASNVIGNKTGFLRFWGYRFQRLFRDPKLKLITKQAQEIYNIYGTSLSNPHRTALEDFIKNPERNFVERIGYAFSTEVYRQFVIDNIILKFLIATNHI